MGHTEKHRIPNLSCFSKALSPTAARALWTTPPPASIPAQKKDKVLRGSPTSWATRLEMRTARLTRPFWALGCRAPVLLSFPAGIAMEALTPHSLNALEPQGPASLVPQQQSQPRLRAQG